LARLGGCRARWRRCDRCWSQRPCPPRLAIEHQQLPTDCSAEDTPSEFVYSLKPSGIGSYRIHRPLCHLALCTPRSTSTTRIRRGLEGFKMACIVANLISVGFCVAWELIKRDGGCSVHSSPRHFDESCLCCNSHTPPWQGSHNHIFCLLLG